MRRALIASLIGIAAAVLLGAMVFAANCILNGDAYAASGALADDVRAIPVMVTLAVLIFALIAYRGLAKRD